MDDFEGFAAFFAEHGERLSRVAYLLTGDRHAAQDLVQSALAKAVSRWRRLANPDAYVRKVMYHEQVSRWRRRARISEDAVAELPDRGVDDESEVTVRRLVLATALTALTPRQRAVVVARYFEDRTEVETAALLGCSVGTVKTLGHRALARLRETVPDLDVDPSRRETV